MVVVVIDGTLAESSDSEGEILENAHATGYADQDQHPASHSALSRCVKDRRDDDQNDY